MHKKRVVLTNVSLTFNTLKVLAMSDEINRFFEVSIYTPVCCRQRQQAAGQGLGRRERADCTKTIQT